MAISQSPLGCDGNLFGNGPHEPNQFSGNGHDHLIGMFASGNESPVTFTEPHLGLPTDILDRFGELFQSQLQMATHLGRIAVGPGPFNESATRMGIARFGNGPLATPCTGGILRGNQPQEFHDLSGIIEARQVSKFGHRGDRDSELHTAEGLKGLDHRVQAPRFDLLLEFVFETLEALGVVVDRTDIFLEDNLLRGCGTDDFGEPPQMGGVPGGPARVADIVSEQEGFEPEFRRLEITDGMYLNKSNFAFPGSTATNRQEGDMKKFMLRYLSSRARVRSRMASSSTVGT
jgi:hypothetical protein